MDSLVCGQCSADSSSDVVHTLPQVSKAQAGNGDNHAVSSLKFRVLRKFLALGYSVFLSDVDIVTLQNPFPHLQRDSDVEGMSDGFYNGTAYGEPQNHCDTDIVGSASGLLSIECWRAKPGGARRPVFKALPAAA